MGLVRPTSGRGTILGYDIVRESIAIRQRVGYLAQDPRFYEQMTARETLRFVARFFYAGPKAAIEARIAESLDLVGLTGKADRPIKGFSGSLVFFFCLTLLWGTLFRGRTATAGISLLVLALLNQFVMSTEGIS